VQFLPGDACTFDAVSKTLLNKTQKKSLKGLFGTKKGNNLVDI
jgi:hypothetical protein